MVSSKREIGRDDGGAALVAVGDEFEEQLGANPIEGHEAELVDNQDLDPQQALLQARELAAIAGFQQLPHQVGCPREEHPSFCFVASTPSAPLFINARASGDTQLTGLRSRPSTPTTLTTRSVPAALA